MQTCPKKARSILVCYLPTSTFQAIPGLRMSTCRRSTVLTLLPRRSSGDCWRLRPAPRAVYPSRPAPPSPRERAPCCSSSATRRRARGEQSSVPAAIVMVRFRSSSAAIVMVRFRLPSMQKSASFGRTRIRTVTENTDPERIWVA